MTGVVTRALVALIALGVAAPALAQTAAVPAQHRLAWDQAAPSLAEAQGYQYAIYVDGGPRTVLSGVTCTGTASPWTCAVPFPALTPGDHQIRLTAAVVVGDVIAESLPSVPFDVRVVVAPQPPSGLRIVR